jgi:oxygen-dependent protoporphyrinogen oxidase
MGKQVLDRIVAPLAAGIYTADINKLSMQATMGPIAEMERKYGSLAKATSSRRRSGEDSVERGSTGARYGQFRALKGGMIELVKQLAETLPEKTVRLNTAARSIQTDGEGWQVTMDGNEERHQFDHLILALPPGPASELLREVAPQAAGELAAIESASTAIVVLGVRRSDIQHAPQTFGFVVPLSENRKILAGSFASQKFAGRAPDDHVLVRVFIGGAMQPELLALSDDELVQIAREELGELIGLAGTPTITRVVRWNEAMPQYHVGHNARAEQIEKSISHVRGLSLVTNALHGVGIAPVVQLADQVAQQVAASFTLSSDAPRGDGVQT